MFFYWLCSSQFSCLSFYVYSYLLGSLCFASLLFSYVLLCVIFLLISALRNVIIYCFFILLTLHVQVLHNWSI